MTHAHVVVACAQVACKYDICTFIVFVFYICMYSMSYNYAAECRLTCSLGL